MEDKWINIGFKAPDIGTVILIWHIQYDEPELIFFDDPEMFKIF